MGWTQDELDGAVRRSRLVRVRRGCYHLMDSDTVDPHEAARQQVLTRSAAAALRICGATVSHHGAGIAHNLPTVHLAKSCVTIAAETETLASGLHLHRQRLEPCDRQLLGAVWLTTPARTVLDIAAESGAAAGIAAADAAVRQGLTTRDELERAYERMYGAPGSVAARHVAQAADGRSESPLESISRLVLDDAPARPQIQVVVADGAGVPIGRVDFLWDELGVVGEADGRVKYADLPTSGESPLWQEKQRQERLADLGLVVFRWGWHEAMNPPLLLAKVDRAMADARRLRAAGIPARHLAFLPASRHAFGP